MLNGVGGGATGPAENAVLTKYTWGLDLSGQRGNVGLASSQSVGGLHGAGGIGGLLGCEETATEGQPKYWFFYDANGNVQQVVQYTTGYPIAARYGYDRYGNPLASETGGTYAAANPFQFSSKWLDQETGMYYYGYRHCAPVVARWLNRDPIDERGGL